MLKTPGRTAIAFGVVLVTLAFALRLAAGLRYGGESVWDGHYYEYYAGRIAGGFGYSDKLLRGDVDVGHPSCHYPVGYSAFLSVFYIVFGRSLLVARLFDSLVGAALAGVTWRLSRYAISESRAKIAGLLVALHPGLVLYGALTMSEPLSSLLTLASFWLRVRTADRGRALVYSALVLGVAALVRPPVLLCAPFLVLPNDDGSSSVEGSPGGTGRAWRYLRDVALTCAVTLLPILPWTARNCRTMDGCALVSTNGGWNLAIGAFPRATGRFETLRSSDGCRDVTGQVQQDRCWFQYGVTAIRNEPGRWLSLLPKKWAYTFDHESFQVEYLHQAKPEMWPDDKRSRGRKTLTFVHTALAALGLFAIVRRPTGALKSARLAALWPNAVLFAIASALSYFLLRGEPSVVWPLVLVTIACLALPLGSARRETLAMKLGLAFAASVFVTHGIFFGEDRYHVVMTPILCLFAASALRKGDARPATSAGA